MHLDPQLDQPAGGRPEWHGHMGVAWIPQRRAWEQSDAWAACMGSMGVWGVIHAYMTWHKQLCHEINHVISDAALSYVTLAVRRIGRAVQCLRWGRVCDGREPMHTDLALLHSARLQAIVQGQNLCARHDILVTNHSELGLSVFDIPWLTGFPFCSSNPAI